MSFTINLGTGQHSFYSNCLLLTSVQVTITFSKNSAIVGPVLFINQLDLCSWSKLAPPYFNRSGVLKWPFVNSTSDNRNLGHPNHSINEPSLYIQTPAIDLEMHSSSVSASPGEPLQITAKPLDELGNPTMSFIRFSDLLSGNSSQEELRRYHFQPQLARYRPDLELATVTYAVNVDDFVINSTVSMSLFELFSNAVVSDKTSIVDIVFTAEQCPFGSALRSGSTVFKVCRCNTVDNPLMVHCEPNSDAIIFVPQTWVTVIIDSNNISSLKGYRCPIDYCREIHNTTLGELTYGSVYSPAQPDYQCTCNRSGILCGSCPEGFGVSILLDRCTTCGSWYASLLVILVIADILVCTGLVLLSKPLPPWVYPCIFYLQILPYTAPNFPLNYGTVRRLPLYFASLTSLYFPYDFCLHRNITATSSYLLRYLPLFTAMLTAIITLTVKHRRGRPLAWHGVWTLVILMYSAVVHTSLTILFCPVVGQHGRRWYISGNVTCFKGVHGALATLAMVVLFFAVIFIPFIVFVSWKNPEKPRWLRYMISPLTRDFKPNLYWWGSMELTRRFLLLLLSVPLPGNPIGPAYILMMSATVYLFVQPYKSQLANILEAVLSLDAILLLLMGSNNAIFEELVLDSKTSLTQIEILFTIPDYCPNLTRGGTRLTLILAPVFYLPMVTFLCGITAAAIFYLQ